MLRNFTIGKKIALLLIVLFSLAGASLTAFLTYEEYIQRRQNLLQETAATVRSGSQVEMALYFRDTEVLQELMEKFLLDPLVDYVAIYDAQGQLISSAHQNHLDEVKLPEFGFIRNGVRPLDTGELTRSREDADRVLDLTIPLMSFVNPLDHTFDRRKFGETLAYARNRGAMHVAGYVHMGIGLQGLEREMVDYAWRVGIGCALVLLVSMFLILMVTRRITAPLSSLAQLAEDIAAGKLDEKFKARGTGEVHQIASMLNTVLSELNTHKAKIDVDRQLLSMKVEERTSQLSKRNLELKQAVKQVTATKNRLRQLAYYDGLTALPNRQLFTEQLDLLLRVSKREKSMLALLFLDLDNFKRINDSLGHTAGDVLLREVAVRLSGCIRDTDLISQNFDSDLKIGVSRLGGDEFTVVLNKVEERETAGAVAERLLESLAAPMMIEGHEVVITPSIGIAIAPDDASNVEDMLKRADTAMYHAKSRGKNSYSFYTSAMKGTGVGRLKLETDLRKAVEREEMVLFYQPQVNILTGDIIGAEALVRWIHPEHGLVPPARFIPLAEEMGLIVEIGAWTMIEACRQCKAFHDQGLQLHKMAVNVSSLQFNPEFIELVRLVLKDSGLPPELLELELTEGVIMSNAKASIDALQELKKLGVTLSVDDFGTGYSSLSYLSRFPLDELKIDRSFVIDYNSSEASASLISAIIAMAQSLRLRLVAEGVDSEDQFHFLRARGVEVIQGYMFSKPLPASDFEGLLRGNHFRDQIASLSTAEAP